ncbi:MAG: HAD family hydrolase [Chloroflexota bacterium]
MNFRAVFFDFGGVIVRTEHQAPRQRLAERLGLEYEDLVKIVFESPTARQASLGEIRTEQHWEAVARRLGLPVAEAQSIRDEFFAGDAVDRTLVEFLRSLRPRYRTGLISNAFPDLREYIVRMGFDDAFDHMVISAEVGVMKPEARIYRIALEALNVKPEESMFVDDFAENVEAARALGMCGIQFKETGKALVKIEQLLDYN